MIGADVSTEASKELSPSCSHLVGEVPISPRTVTVAFVLKGKRTQTMKTSSHYLVEELR